MSAAKVLQAARAAGIHFAVDGNDLLLTSSVPPPPGILDLLRYHKTEVVVALTTGIPFEMPCPERRGLVERQGGAFLHFCIQCGRWGAYGYRATGDRPGQWYCRLHRSAE
jgi:hypothetical protein